MIYDEIEKDLFERRVYIHRTAIVYPGVVIEGDVEIGPYCIIGKRPEILNGLDTHECGKVTIRSGTRIEGFCTIDSGSKGATVIGPDSFLMKQTHVGHDAVLGANVTLSPGARVGGECTLGDYVNVGMNAVIHQQTAIPKKCMIGMGAVVTKKAAAQMQPAETWAGNPAEKLGMNKKWL